MKIRPLAVLFTAVLSSLFTFAVEPIAVWESFTGADADGGLRYGSSALTLSANGNEIAADGGSITITQANGILVDGFMSGTVTFTVLVKYRNLNLAASATQSLITSNNSNGDNRLGVSLLANNGGIVGQTQVDGWEWRKSSTVGESLSSSGSFAFTHASASGTYVYVQGVNGSKANGSVYGASDLKYGPHAYDGVAIGGLRSGTNLAAASGMIIEGVAVFDSVISQDEIDDFTWSESDFVWSNVDSDGNTPAARVFTRDSGAMKLLLSAQDGCELGEYVVVKSLKFVGHSSDSTMPTTITINGVDSDAKETERFTEFSRTANNRTFTFNQYVVYNFSSPLKIVAGQSYPITYTDTCKISAVQSEGPISSEIGNWPGFSVYCAVNADKVANQPWHNRNTEFSLSLASYPHLKFRLSPKGSLKLGDKVKISSIKIAERGDDERYPERVTHYLRLVVDGTEITSNQRVQEANWRINSSGDTRTAGVFTFPEDTPLILAVGETYDVDALRENLTCGTTGPGGATNIQADDYREYALWWDHEVSTSRNYVPIYEIEGTKITKPYYYFPLDGDATNLGTASVEGKLTSSGTPGFVENSKFATYSLRSGDHNAYGASGGSFILADTENGLSTFEDGWAISFWFNSNGMGDWRDVCGFSLGNIDYKFEKTRSDSLAFYNSTDLPKVEGDNAISYTAGAWVNISIVSKGEDHFTVYLGGVKAFDYPSDSYTGSKKVWGDGISALTKVFMGSYGLADSRGSTALTSNYAIYGYALNAAEISYLAENEPIDFENSDSTSKATPVLLLNFYDAEIGRTEGWINHTQSAGNKIPNAADYLGNTDGPRFSTAVKDNSNFKNEFTSVETDFEQGTYVDIFDNSHTTIAEEVRASLGLPWSTVFDSNVYKSGIMNGGNQGHVATVAGLDTKAKYVIYAGFGLLKEGASAGTYQNMGFTIAASGYASVGALEYVTTVAGQNTAKTAHYQTFTVGEEICPGEHGLLLVRLSDIKPKSDGTISFTLSGERSGINFLAVAKIGNKEDDTLPSQTSFSWSTGSAPSGWITSWEGEAGGSTIQMLNSKGVIAEQNTVYHFADSPETQKWHPCAWLTSKGAYTLSSTICTDFMLTPTEGKYAVLWSMGWSDDRETILAMDDERQIVLVSANGGTIEKQIVGETIRGYHLITVTFDTMKGAALAIDGDFYAADITFNTQASDNFQIGSIFGGLIDPFVRGDNLVIEKLQGYDVAITEGAIAKLADGFPKVVMDKTITFNSDGSFFHLPSITIPDGKQLRVQAGRLVVPTGVEATLAAMEFGDKEGSPNYGMDLYGKITIENTKEFTSNYYNTAYDACNEGRGVDFGEWTGIGTYNIFGEFNAPKTVVELVHNPAASTTFNIRGAFRVLGVVAANGERTTINLTDGGEIDYGRYPSCSVSIAKNYGNGTIRCNSSWTDTDDITLSGETTFDVAAEVTATLAGTITGEGTIRKTGAGVLMLSASRPLVDIQAGKLGIILTEAEMAAGTVTIQVPESADFLWVSKFEFYDNAGSPLKLKSFSVDSEASTFSFSVTALPQITEDTILSDLNLKTTDRGTLYVHGGADEEHAITVTYDVAIPESVSLSISGNVRFVGAGEGETLVIPANKLMLQEGAVFETGLPLDGEFTIDSSRKLIINGVDICDNMTVKIGGELVIEGEVRSTAGISLSNKRDAQLTINPEAKLIFDDVEYPFGSGRTCGTYNIYGTLDLGSSVWLHNYYWQNFDGACILNLYVGSKIVGTANNALKRGGGAGALYLIKDREEIPVGEKFVTLDISLGYEAGWSYETMFVFDEGTGLKMLKPNSRAASGNMLTGTISLLELPAGEGYTLTDGSTINGEVVVNGDSANPLMLAGVTDSCVITKSGSGLLDVGLARPTIKIEDGGVLFAVSEEEELSGEVSIPVMDGEDFSIASKISLYNSSGNVLKINGASIDAELNLLTFMLKSLPQISEDTVLSALELGSNDAGMIAVVGGDSEESAITVTFDTEVPTAISFSISGYARFVVAGEVTEIDADINVNEGDKLTLAYPGIHSRVITGAGSVEVDVGKGNEFVFNAANTFTGGLIIKSGTAKTKNAIGYGPNNYTLWATPEALSQIEIKEGATLDLANTVNTSYAITTAGTITNSGSDIDSGKRQTVKIALSGDATVSGNTFGLLATSHNATTLDLGDHTLTMAMNEEKTFILSNTTIIGSGTIKLKSGSLWINPNKELTGTIKLDLSEYPAEGGMVATGSAAQLEKIVLAEGQKGWKLTIDGTTLFAEYVAIFDPETDTVATTPVLRFSEIMPKPSDKPGEITTQAGYDKNGLESGWVELENTSDMWVNLKDYKFCRANRGKVYTHADYGNFPEVMIPPHGRYTFYTSERYPNSYPEGKDGNTSAWQHGDFDGNPRFYGDMLVWGDKVNPKKFPYVTLVYRPESATADEILETVIIPSDTPEGYSIIVGEKDETSYTKRWLCPSPTKNAPNTDTKDLRAIGPNVGPKYGAKHSVNEFVAVPPAKIGEAYPVSLNVNPVYQGTEQDAITDVVLVYRTKLGKGASGTVTMVKSETGNAGGDVWTAEIPSEAIPAEPGQLIQWKTKIVDAAGNEWTSPSFMNPDDGYEWFGTITEPGELNSAKLPTWHMFIDDASKAQMDIDANKQTLENNARVAIYDASTSNYYDYVRIDLRGNTSALFNKKSHGLRFSKVNPLTMYDPVRKTTWSGVRKSSLIGEPADPSFMRQMVGFWLWNKMGNLTPFDFPVRCNLNGEFYQLGFHSERFTDELIEDIYKLDKYGYGYKNVGTLISTSAGGAEKKTPDDGNEKDMSMLKTNLVEHISAAQKVNEDNATLTQEVVKRFDLPAWINYLASARITQEMDDVWANISIYRDSAEMKEGARGTGTWMPLGYDFNVSFGQYYHDGIDLRSQNVLMADQDWFKSHPFYGGMKVRCHSGSFSAGTVNNGNLAMEAVYQSSKFRRLYLRRLRTLMDQELKAPGTPESEVPFMVKMREMAELMKEDAALDRDTYGWDTSFDKIDAWGEKNWPADISAGVDNIWEKYVVPRRQHLYVTHSITNTANAVGYGSQLNAGIPEAQSPIESLKDKIYAEYGDRYGVGIVEIVNANNETIDMSGWTLGGPVQMTLPPGTVIDSMIDNKPGYVYIVTDRRKALELNPNVTDEVIIGNAKAGNAAEAISLLVEGVDIFQPEVDMDDPANWEGEILAGEYSESKELSGGNYILKGATFSDSLIITGSAKFYTYPETVNSIANLVSSGSLTLAGSGTLTLNGTTGSMSVGEDLIIENGVFNVIAENGTPKGAVVLVNGNYLQKNGTVNVTLGSEAEDGVQLYGIALNNKNTSATIENGEFNATMSGNLCAALKLKGSCTGNFKGGVVNGVLSGAEAKVFYGGSQNYSDGKYVVTMPAEATGATGVKPFCADRMLTISGGEFDVKIPTEGSEAISTAGDGDKRADIEISGGVLKLEAGDDPINAAMDINITGGFVHAVSTNSDALDANGSMSITGGYVFAFTKSPEHEALDVIPSVDNGLTHTLTIGKGAMVLAVGGKPIATEILGDAAKLMVDAETEEVDEKYILFDVATIDAEAITKTTRNFAVNWTDKHVGKIGDGSTFAVMIAAEEVGESYTKGKNPDKNLTKGYEYLEPSYDKVLVKTVSVEKLPSPYPEGALVITTPGEYTELIEGDKTVVVDVGAGNTVTFTQGNSFTGGLYVYSGTAAQTFSSTNNSKLGGFGANNYDNVETMCHIYVKEGATLDLANTVDASYIVHSAGTIVNSGSTIGVGSRQMTQLILDGDTTIKGNTFGIVRSGHNPATLDLGGYTLTLDMESETTQFVTAALTIMNPGVIKIKNGQFFIKADKTFAVESEGTVALDISSLEIDTIVVSGRAAAFDSFVLVEGQNGWSLEKSNDGLKAVYAETEPTLAEEDETTEEIGLMISEIMPKASVWDENHLDSGWLEVVNVSQKNVNFGDYTIARFNRGKVVEKLDKWVNGVTKKLAPGERLIIKTSEDYPHAGDKTITQYDEDLGGAIVLAAKVNPKKYQMVVLAKGTKVVQRCVVPVDVPEDKSVCFDGDALNGAKVSRICTATKGKRNALRSGIPVGPQISPLYGVADTEDYWTAFEKATIGTDYAVSVPVNPIVDGNEKNEIAAVNLIYQIGWGEIVTNEVAMVKAETADPLKGAVYSGAIPGAAIEGDGQLVRWAVKITDKAGNAWRSPSFNNPEDGFEWYGTITTPSAEQTEGGITTFHIFADPDEVADTPGSANSTASCLMNIDEESTGYRTKKHPYGAYVGIYDNDTGKYYDKVRIDRRGNTSGKFTKKAHGLKFAKAQPFKGLDSVSGEMIECRKSSFTAEYADPSFVRQGLSFKTLNDHGSKAPFHYPVRLNLNGEFYQLAFHTERFSDELIEDFYGLDGKGYGYKNIGPFNPGVRPVSGGIEKKTPDDGVASDGGVLNAFCAKLADCENISELNTSGVTEATPDSAFKTEFSPELTKVVTTDFDLPAWLNYIALSKITGETDDVWANLSGYYDVNKTGTWMPLAYDMNQSFGQWHWSDDWNYNFGDKCPATDDHHKAHPLYGGLHIMVHYSGGAPYSSSNGKTIATKPYKGNRCYEAIFQNVKYRRLYLRRLRTLMDAEFGGVSADKDGTPIYQRAKAMVERFSAVAAMDRKIWTNYESSAAELWVFGHKDVWTVEEGLEWMWTNYIEPRRQHLYVTHAAEGHDASEIGYGETLCAGIPAAQSATLSLRDKITAEYVADKKAVVIRNANTETIDLSNWKLEGPVNMTLPAGTVIDQAIEGVAGELFVSYDRKATVAAFGEALHDQIIVGNGTFGKESAAIALTAADETKVIFTPTPEYNYLRLHSFDGCTAVVDGDDGEWFALTNISDSVSLNLEGVRVQFLKAGDLVAKMDVTLTAGTVEPNGSVKFIKSDFDSTVWDKITNNEIFITIWDSNSAIVQTAALKQKSFKDYYGVLDNKTGDKIGGAYYLEATSFGETLVQADFTQVAYPSTAPETWDEVEVTEDTTVEELVGSDQGAVLEAFKVEPAKIVEWAKEYSKSTKPGEAINLEAFALSCAPDEVETKKEDFKVTITLDENGTPIVETVEGIILNITPVIKGAIEVGGPYELDLGDQGARFFKAFIELPSEE